LIDEFGLMNDDRRIHQLASWTLEFNIGTEKYKKVLLPN